MSRLNSEGFSTNEKLSQKQKLLPQDHINEPETEGLNLVYDQLGFPRYSA